MDNIDIPVNQKDDVYNVILDREGLHQFLAFLSKQNSSEVDYGVNKFGEVFINIKENKKFKIIPINFYRCIVQKINALQKTKSKIKLEKNKEHAKLLTKCIDIVYEIINENKN